MLLSESPRLVCHSSLAKGHPPHRHEADISHDCFPFEKFSRLLIIRLQLCLFKGQHAAPSRMAGKRGRETEKRKREIGYKQWRWLKGFSFFAFLLELSQGYDSWSDRERIWDKQRREALCLTVTPVLSVCSHQPLAGTPSTSLSLLPNSNRDC